VGHFFPNEPYVATVAAGEASGKMATVLQQLAGLQRSELRMSRTIRSLIAYPIVLASVSFVVIMVLVLFVLPQFAGIFEQYDTPLPILTRMLLGLAYELRAHWWLWGPLAALLVAGLVSLRFSEVGRHQWDRFILHCRPVQKRKHTEIGPLNRFAIDWRIAKMTRFRGGIRAQSMIEWWSRASAARKCPANYAESHSSRGAIVVLQHAA
jgi:type II secretory pathway component PulF